MVSPDKPATFNNYDEFVGTGASLMLATLLIDSCYEDYKDELPPIMLEFDLAGSLTFDDDMVVFEGGEIKSSTSGMFL